MYKFIHKNWLLIILVNSFNLHHAVSIKEVSLLSPVEVDQVIKPNSLKELQNLIIQSKKPISFAGGRYSQGGQIACPDGLVIDTVDLNKIISFDKDNKTITVQPGIRWKDIQHYIDPYNLSVRVMQSYNEFTVGGSLSVNVHGRDLLGSLIKTVVSCKILTADGSIIFASKDKNSDLFYAAIGGYGLLGAIIEVTLQLTDNTVIEKVAKNFSLPEYLEHFYTNIQNNPDIIFHNANIYPNDFEQVIATSWYKTDKQLTNKHRLQQESFYLKQKAQEQVLRRISYAKKIRLNLDLKKIDDEEIVYRNYEMSYSVNSLEPLLRWPTTSILQEYFIPMHNAIEFIESFKKIVKKHSINVLNVSIRYVAKENLSVLTYAPQDSFAFVCYINVPHTKQQHKERIWTQEIINAVLKLQGTFYLPYHLYATPEQFKTAYPQYKNFLKIKHMYDPYNKFQNCLYKKYMTQ